LELAALAALMVAVFQVRVWYPLSVLILVVTQALATLLVHCPAHYLVGSILGIKFSRMTLGRSTLVRALPPSIRGLGSVLLVFSLSVDKESRRTASLASLRVMYLSGVVGSIGTAFAFALLVTLSGGVLATFLSWLFAAAYLLSDMVLSPRSGDLMRARAVVKRS